MSYYVGSSEIVQVADVVAREKGINKDLVVEAIELALVKPAARQYGQDKDIKIVINKKTGDIKTYRRQTVIADDEVPETEDAGKVIRLSDAAEYGDNPETDAPYAVGEVISEELPPIDLRRVTAQIAKQVILQKIREAEREREYNEFIGRAGEIVHGIVKRIEFGNVIVDLNGTEALLARDHVIRGEVYNANDRVRALIAKVRRENVLPQILLSRTAPDFMKQLFTLEVPEVYEGIIEIRAVARDPGSRAKMAIFSSDPNIDPVGSCVGVRGTRVQAVSSELRGERVDIIPWSPEPAAFLISAIAPAQVAKVIINEDEHSMDVVVAEEEQSIAIGRRGQNVRLASELTGWRINIMTEEAEAAKRADEFNSAVSLFTEGLDVDDIIAHLLAGEGYRSVGDIAYAETGDLASIEGFSEEIAEELQRRAQSWLELKAEQERKEIEALGAQPDLLALLEGRFNAEQLKLLTEEDVKTADDFAGLAGDELQEIIGEDAIDIEEANALIMKARAAWFADEEDAETAAGQEDAPAEEEGAA